MTGLQGLATCVADGCGKAGVRAQGCGVWGGCQILHPSTGAGSLRGKTRLLLVGVAWSGPSFPSNTGPAPRNTGTCFRLSVAQAQAGSAVPLDTGAAMLSPSTESPKQLPLRRGAPGNPALPVPDSATLEPSPACMCDIWDQYRLNWTHLEHNQVTEVSPVSARTVLHGQLSPMGPIWPSQVNIAQSNHESRPS